MKNLVIDRFSYQNGWLIVIQIMKTLTNTGILDIN